MMRPKGFNYRHVASAVRPGLLARIGGPKTGICSPAGEKRPPRIAPAASEGIDPTLDPSEESTRQNRNQEAEP